MRHKLRCDARRDEDGYTLVELLATVVIMGIVMAPLSMVVVQSLTLVPQAGARTHSAIAHQRIINQFATDAATANPSCHEVACPSPGSVLVMSQWKSPYTAVDGGPSGTLTSEDDGVGPLTCKAPGTADTDLVEFSSTDVASTGAPTTFARWLLRWTTKPAPVNNTRVELVRREWAAAASPREDVYQVMYCQSSGTVDSGVAKVTVINAGVAETTRESVTLELAMRDAAAELVPTVTLSASVRSG